MLQIKNLSKTYKTKGGVVTRALDGVSVDFPEKGLVFLLGKSGSGKSTLLNMIGGLDRPDSGEVIVKGRSSKDFSQSDFDSYRNTYIGFIFQEYNILNEFNIEQNISLALQLQGKKNDKDAVDALLKEVDLEGFNKRKPNTLSGGQKQRIAIARALIKDPEIIMADEPTGALDSNTGKQVLEILKRLSQTKLVIIVSHDQDFAEEYGDRIIELKDGKIISDKTKGYVAPKSLSENVTVVNENVIDIKDTGKLSEADFKEIYKLIKKQKGEVLISSGEDTVKATKKAAKVSEGNHSEVFSDTTKIEMKDYNGSETKFIRSRMPFARAFKMGASGLKTKPVRLVFTILLSVVSMTLFGTASTLMFYKPSYSLSVAMANLDRSSEAILKNFRIMQYEQTIDNTTGKVVSEGEPWQNYTSDYFGKAELKDLNEKNNDRFIGVHSFAPGNEGYTNYISFGSSVYRPDGESRDYYECIDGFLGFSDASASWVKNQGFSVYGQEPHSDDEIAISNVAFDYIKAGNSFTGLNNYDDIVGKKLNISSNSLKNVELTITAVYDFGPVPSKYETLKSEKPAIQSSEERRKEQDVFKAYLDNSIYTVGFVSPSFIDKYGIFSTEQPVYLDSVYPKGFAIEVEYEGMGQFDPGTIDARAGYSSVAIFEDALEKGIKFYDNDFVEIESPELKDDEVFLSDEQYFPAFMREKYYGKVENLFRQADIYDYGDPAYEEFCYDLNSVGDNKDPDKSAIIRLKRAAENGAYEEGYDIEEDRDLAVSVLTPFVKRGYSLLYGQNISSLIQAYIDNGGSVPSGWYDGDKDNARQSLANKEIEDEAFASLKNYFQTAIASDSGMSYIPTVAFADTLSNVANRYGSSKVIEAAQSVGCDSWWYLLTYAADDSYSSDSMEKIKTFSKNLFKSLYGKDISDTEFSSFFGGVDKIEPYYVEDVYLPTKCYSKDFNGVIKTYKVKGFVASNHSYFGDVVLTRNALKPYLVESYSWVTKTKTDYVSPDDARYSYLVTTTDYSQRDIDLFLQDDGIVFYQMTNEVYRGLRMYTESVAYLSSIFLVIGGVTGLFAGLLLLNFISVSIASKKKDIGILRAVGARGSDVFKVFYSESGIIAAICFVLSTIATFIVCLILNNEMMNSGLGVPILEFGPVSVLIILGISAVFSFVATFLPVLLAAKKPPVEAIRAL